VAGGIDQVDLVFLIVLRRVIHAHCGGFDRDAFFALEVHVVEHLRGHITVGDGACQLQQAVCERGFAVVYMGDNAEVADMVGHCVRKYNRVFWPQSPRERRASFYLEQSGG
jgi:hypothetical protein